MKRLYVYPEKYRLEEIPLHGSTIRRIGLLALFLAVFAGGCAARMEQPGFESVQETVADRTAMNLHWHDDLIADEQTADAITEMLRQPLTSDTAAQIALLNNRRIQAVYRDLEISQADLIQAGLLSNPLFDASVLFPVNNGNTEINLGIRLQFLEIFMLPLRKRVGQSQFEETKARVSSRVMALAYATRIAFFQAEADNRRLKLQKQSLLTAELSDEFAQRLLDAGNITELQRHEERDRYEMSKLKLRRAETSAFKSRETLNRLMGLWGDEIHWEFDNQSPYPESFEWEDGTAQPDLTSRAIKASLDLEIIRHRIVTIGHRLGVDNITALIPTLELGVEAERNGDWALGPSLAIPIPLFDRGQARLARTRAELRRQQEHYTDLTVQLRSRVRENIEQLHSSGDIARYYRNVVLPLRTRIVNETQLQYHAMRVGPLALLLAKDREFEAEMEYISAVENYRVTRTRLEQLMSGVIPGHANEADW